MLKGKLKFEGSPIKNFKIYNLYLASIEDQQYYAKVFDEQILQKYGLDQTLQYNIQVLTDSINYIYPDHFLHIQATCNQKEAVILLMKKYDYKLDQFIVKNGPMNQRQALKIFQQILKAVYSIVMVGYWHRNLKAQNIVKCGDKWKLQSFVFTEVLPSRGLQSQYVYNSQYQPPQAYERPNFTDQQLQQRIVWDLGCLLIHLLLGVHKLKNQSILNKFKNEPFSFEKIGVSKGEQFTAELKQILGKMCHYNEKQRMSLDQLIMNGFFSKQLAKHYSLQKEKKQRRIFIGGSGSVSQSLSMKQNLLPGVQPINADKIAQNLRKSQKKHQVLLSSQRDGKIEEYAKFNQKISSIIQQQSQPVDSSKAIKEQSSKRNEFFKKTSIQKLLSLQEIKNQQSNQIINIYKNYLDKGQILAIGAQKCQAMLQLFDKPQLGKNLIDLTQFSLNFIKTIDLCKLARAFNQNKQFFKFTQKQWQKFHGSPQYHAIKQIVAYREKQSLQKIQALRKKLLSKKNKFVQQKQNIKIFVNNCKPQETQFSDIKESYRRILKLSYDLIAQHYTKNKKQQWARLGMYLTFCLAIDKMYIQEEFQDNFKYYFSWSKKQPSNYVSLYQFQTYLDSAQKQQLVQNSRFIIEKFYQI